jgi:hypothetical protein
MAGHACEAQGCVRTLSSKWLADGRCCTTKACEEQFNVGKGKAKDAEAVAASPCVKKRKQLPALLPALPLAHGRTLLQLAPGAFYDDLADDGYEASEELLCYRGNLDCDAYEQAEKESWRKYITNATDELMCDMPYAVVNVRRNDPADFVFEDSILLTGTFGPLFCPGEPRAHNLPLIQTTKWLAIERDLACMTVGVMLKALALLKEKGAHADDVARWSAFQWHGRDGNYPYDDCDFIERTIGEWERMEYTGL